MLTPWSPTELSTGVSLLSIADETTEIVVVSSSLAALSSFRLTASLRSVASPTFMTFSPKALMLSELTM
jgi:hypothetical protein